MQIGHPTSPFSCDLCCQHEMRMVALIDAAEVIERILRHLGLWQAGVRSVLRTPKNPTLDSHRPIWDLSTNEITASSFKLRANVPKGGKAISYQLILLGSADCAVKLCSRCESSVWGLKCATSLFISSRFTAKVMATSLATFRQ